MSFLKSKISNPLSLSSLYSNLSPEAKFIIWGIFYTVFAIPALAQIRMFDLFTFFGIYFCYQHLHSKPAFNKNRWFISCAIMVILILESLMLISYGFFIFSSMLENIELTMLISLFFFFIYWITTRIKSNPNKISEIFKTIFIYRITTRIKSNPNKISEILKTIFCEYFQLFAVVIFYIYATHLIVQRYELPYIITLMIINLIILTSTNILSKKTSTILEILCFGYLFLALTFFSIPIKKEFISPENKIAIFLVILNFISFAIVFLKNKNYAEKTKIILLALLMMSFFFADKPNVCSLYFITTFIIVRFVIVYEKLSTLNASIFFTFILIMICVVTMSTPTGRGGGPGYELVETTLLQLIILPIIVFFSNRTLKKRRLKNDIQNLKIN